jgi:FkbM family methyltransferase
MSARQTALRGARRLGVESKLRATHQATQRVFEGRARRRSRRDDDNLLFLFPFLLRADDNCIDVGANVGEVLVDMVRAAPDGRHIAYEPLPELAAKLRDRFPEVDVRNAALSDRRGEAEFFRVKEAPSRSGLRTEPDPGGTVEPIVVATEQLDDVLDDDFVPALIKIDVEGAEALVLEGAIETLARHKPIVALEHGDTAGMYGTTHGDIHALLCDRAGLRVFDMDGGGPYSRDAFEKACADGARWNWLARA